MAPRFATATCLLAAVPQLASAFDFGNFGNMADSFSKSLEEKKEEAMCLKDVGTAAAHLATCMKDGSVASDCDTCMTQFYTAAGPCADKHSTAKTLVDETASHKDSCYKAVGMKADVECMKTVGMKSKDLGSCITSGGCSECIGKFEQDTASCASQSSAAKALVDKAKAEQAGCEKITQMQDQLSGVTTGLNDKMKEAQSKAQGLQDQMKEAQSRAQAQLGEMPKVGALQDKVKEAQAKAEDAAAQAKEAVGKLNVGDVQAKANQAAGQLQETAKAKFGELPQVSDIQQKAKEAQTRASAELGDLPQVGQMDDLIDSASAQAGSAFAEVNSKSIELTDKVTEAVSALKGSCASFGCKTDYNEEHPCHCTALCETKKNCCVDYKAICTGVAGAVNNLSAAAQAAEVQAETLGAAAADKMSDAFGKVEALKQCTDKSVEHLQAAKTCIAAKPTAVCECAADFNASMKPCVEHLKGQTVDEMPGAAGCPTEVLADIKGAMTFSVSDPEAFVADLKAPKAIEDTVAKLAGLSDSKYVSAILKPFKDFGLGRRLAEGANVKADYTIAVPQSSELFANVTAAAEKIKDSAAEAQAVLSSKIKESLGDKFNVSGLKQELSANGQSLMDQMLPAVDGQDNPQHGHPNYMLYVGIFLLATAVVGGAVYFFLTKDPKPEKKKKRAAKKPAASPAPAMAPVVQPVSYTMPTPAQSFTSITSQAPLLQSFAHAAPVPTQSYHMPVYYPATTAAPPVQSSPAAFSYPTTSVRY